MWKKNLEHFYNFFLCLLVIINLSSKSYDFEHYVRRIDQILNFDKDIPMKVKKKNYF